MTTPRARELRTNMTEAERALWKHLRLRQLDGFKFRRQQPIDQYIVDFACLEARVLVEVDGGHHAETVSQDAARDTWLESQGFRVLRFWNSQVLGETSAVLETIRDALIAGDDSPHPNPPPQGGRG